MPASMSQTGFFALAVQSVEAVWRVDGQAATSRLLLQEDDGVDSSYFVDILPQPNRTIVAFQLVLTSLTGQTDTYPPTPGVGGRTPFYLYEVDNDPPLTNGHPSYRVILSKADVDSLKGRPLQNDVLLNCTFIGDGEVHHMAAIRYRGENSRGNERKSYRIELPPEDSFQGIEKLNLNAAYGGTPPTSSVRDFLSADLFRRAGLPYPVEWPANLYFTRGVSGDLQGRSNVDPFYVFKENFDRDFLSRFFSGSDGGNFYRPRDPGGGSGDLSYRGEDESAYVRFYEKKSNSDADDYSDVIELTRAFDRTETPDAVFESEMRRLLDVKEWAAFFAVQDYLTNIDGGIQTMFVRMRRCGGGKSQAQRGGAQRAMQHGLLQVNARA